jgi:DnaD/phage-associated family protein
MSNARFSILQSKAVGDEKISNAQFRTLAALGTFGDKDGWCFPKLKTLSEILKKSKQAISMDLKELENLGYIEIKHQFHEDGSQKFNLYRLIFDIKQPEYPEYPLTPPEPGLTPPEYPLSSEVDGGLSKLLNGGLSSEVDPLTPHINAPFNAPLKLTGSGSDNGEIFKIYEKEIGPLTPFIADDLKDAEQTYPKSWIIAAVQESARQNKRSLKYILAILKRWQVDGFHSVNKNGNGNKPLKHETPLDRTLAAAKEAMQEALKEEEQNNGNKTRNY